MEERPVVGVLVTDAELELERDFMVGIAEAADAEDVSLVYFVGGSLHRALEIDPGEPMTRSVYDLAVSRRLDGVIISSPMGYLVPGDVLQRFCERYAPLPIVTGALDLEGVAGGYAPQVLTDSFAGMRQAITHLIEVHGRRRIAFIQGPADQPEAQARYRAYEVALADHGIAVDERLVVRGDFLRPSGVAAVQELLRRAVHIDAVAAANDETAAGAFDVLVAKGLAVPGDVALVGFDDAAVGRHLPVPLTTVRQSFRSIGYRALETLMTLIRGGGVPQTLALPAELIVRRSCGCMPGEVERAGVHGIGRGAGRLAGAGIPAGVKSRDLALENVSMVLRTALVKDLTMGTEGFLEALEVRLRESFRRREPLGRWHDHLSALRRELVPSLETTRDVEQAEDLLHQARVLISEAAERLQVAVAEEREQLAGTLRGFASTTAGLMTLDDLPAPMADTFPRLGIHRAYVALVDDGAGSDAGAPGSPTADAGPAMQARLALAYADGVAGLPGVMTIGTTGATDVYSASDFLPDRIYPSQERFTWVAYPLELRDRWFGFLLLEIDVREPSIPRRVAEAVSSILFRAALLRDVEEARERAEASLAEITRTRAISDRLQQAPDVEAVLRIALEELSEVLQAPVAVARLGTREQLLAMADRNRRQADPVGDSVAAEGPQDER